MFQVDVLTCFAASSAGALVGSALIANVHTDLPRVRQALTLHQWAFAFLLPLGLTCLLPEASRTLGLRLGIAADLVGVALIGWGMRQLNGRRTPPTVAVSTIALAGLVVALSAFADARTYLLVSSSAFFLLALAITVDQGWLVLASPRVSRSEVALLVVAVLFAFNWLVTLIYAADYQQAMVPNVMVAPPWLMPWAGVSYALLPLALAALVLSTINERLVQQLRTRALTDDLTGALSRRGLREMGERMLTFKASRPKLLAVLMIDVDFFKRVNDSFGHQCGDDVLRHITAVARERLRTDALLARYGGEEFTVLLPVGEMHEAHVVAERLRVALESTPCMSKHGPIKITVSIGLAFHRETANLEEALGRADRCLYAAKESGRNRVVVDTSN